MNCTAAIAAALLATAPLAPLQAAEDWRFGTSGEFSHDDNATRGLYDGKKADNIAVVEGSMTRSLMLSGQSGLLLRAAARYSHFTDVKDISNLALSGRAAWRYQPRPEFGALWYQVVGEAQLLRHADSELRDGSILGAEASAGRYVTDRTRLAAGIGFDKRSGGGTAGLYDLTTMRLFGTADVRVGVRNTLYARLAHQTGDHVFSAGSVTGLSGVWEDDPALRQPLGLAVANAYRVDATTMIFEVGFNYPLSSAGGLDFSVARYDTKVGEGPYEGNKYGATQIRATYLHRFQ